jgi:hypothetical protein
VYERSSASTWLPGGPVARPNLNLGLATVVAAAQDTAT